MDRKSGNGIDRFPPIHVVDREVIRSHCHFDGRNGYADLRNIKQIRRRLLYGYAADRRFGRAEIDQGFLGIALSGIVNSNDLPRSGNLGLAIGRVDVCERLQQYQLLKIGILDGLQCEKRLRIHWRITSTQLPSKSL